MIVIWHGWGLLSFTNLRHTLSKKDVGLKEKAEEEGCRKMHQAKLCDDTQILGSAMFSRGNYRLFENNARLWQLTTLVYAKGDLVRRLKEIDGLSFEPDFKKNPLAEIRDAIRAAIVQLEKYLGPYEI